MLTQQGKTAVTTAKGPQQFPIAPKTENFVKKEH